MTLRIGSIALTPERREAFEDRIDAINRMQADILLVAGFRTGIEGMQVRGTLDRLGLIYQTACDTEPEEEALILGSRAPYLAVDLEAGYATQHRSCLHLGIADFRIIAADLTEEAPAAALPPYLLRLAQALLREKTLLLIRSAAAPTTPGGVAQLRRTEELVGALMDLGYLDAHSLAHRPTASNDSQPAEPNTGMNRPPFRSLLTPALAPQLSGSFSDGPTSEAPTANTCVLKMG